MLARFGRLQITVILIVFVECSAGIGVRIAPISNSVMMLGFWSVLYAASRLRLHAMDVRPTSVIHTMCN